MSKNHSTDQQQEQRLTVPNIVFEGEMARMERYAHRLWITIIALIAAILIVIGAFLWYLNQYDFISDESITVDGTDGIANYVIGNEGLINNGSDSNTTNTVTLQEKRFKKGDCGSQEEVVNIW